MICHIIILSILCSTMLVNAAPSIQDLRSFARGMGDPTCNDTTGAGITPYNPSNLDPQSLNIFYSLQLSTPRAVCSRQALSTGNCTRACTGTQIASCGTDGRWAGTPCDDNEGCYAYPAEGNVTKIGCLSSDEVYTIFANYGYHDGPFVKDRPSQSRNPPSSTVPLSSSTNVLSSSMSSSASLPTMTSSDSLNKGPYSSSLSPTLSTPINTLTSSLMSTPSSVNPYPSSHSDSGLDFTPTSISDQSDPPTTSTPLESSRTSMMSSPVPSSSTSLSVNNSGPPLSTSSGVSSSG